MTNRQQMIIRDLQLVQEQMGDEPLAFHDQLCEVLRIFPGAIISDLSNRQLEGLFNLYARQVAGEKSNKTRQQVPAGCLSIGLNTKPIYPEICLFVNLIILVGKK